ncbi:MAG: winged helix DNA-binding domain-containing protein [Candidatus Limnocylindria bacterium]
MLSLRALNRALLARQFLLRREPLDVLTAIDRLAGIQAQWSPSPYIALWSRLERFAIDDLQRELEQRTVVKATLMRLTLHMVSAREYPNYAVATTAGRRPPAAHAGRTLGVDVAGLRERVLAATREPSSWTEIKAFIEGMAPPDLLEGRYALLMATDLHGWMLSTPPSGSWRYFGGGRYVDAQAWLRPFALPSPDEATTAVVERYLGAFGPASRADLASWSGIRLGRGLGPALVALAPRLCVFEDERGRTLYDLASAPRPDAGEPAPPRYLPKWDSTLLAYAPTARDRILPEPYRGLLIGTNGDIRPTFLVDGMVAGTWEILRQKARQARLVLSPFDGVARAYRAKLVEEGERLVRFVEPDSRDHAVDLPR